MLYVMLCCHKFFGEGVPFIVSSWKKRKLRNINSVIIIRGFYGFLFHCWVPNNFSLGCRFIYGVGVGRVCTERRVSYIARVSAVLVLNICCQGEQGEGIPGPPGPPGPPGGITVCNFFFHGIYQRIVL